MAYEFRLPDIGEGLTEGEIVKWHVSEGDAVQENQPIVNVLTDKAEVEIPSPKTGVISKLFAKNGEKVAVGAVIVAIDAADGSSAKPSHDGGAHAAPAAPAAQKKDAGVSATPAVRKLAADFKVDLGTLTGTGPGGRVTEDDVRKASGGKPAAAPMASSGPEERVPFKGIRRRTGEKMAQSARTIPHVTHVDEADVTELVALRAGMKTEGEKRGVKMTFLPFILKALTLSLKDFPNLNSSLDEAKEEILLKKHYNIGLAVSTDNGLYVPVLKDADKKDLWTLAKEVSELAAKARDNKLAVSELQGGTFTITNIGPIGGLFATPIVNHPEAAILGVMKIQERPAVRDGKIVVRSTMNLCLSFDHRLLDGAEAAAFTNALIGRIESPKSLA